MERNLPLIVLYVAAHLVIPVHAQNATILDQQTPNYDLCVSTLNSDPQTRWAKDIRGLTTILVLHLKDKATQTRDHIAWFLKDPFMDQQRKQLLSQCMDRYNTIVMTWLRETLEGLSNKDYGFARESMGTVPTNVELCERSFQGPVQSPISEDSKTMDDLSKVAYAIVLYLYLYRSTMKPIKKVKGNPSYVTLQDVKLPRASMEKMLKMKGREVKVREEKQIAQKRLRFSDIDPSLNRLMIPVERILNEDFLTDDEKAWLDQKEKTEAKLINLWAVERVLDPEEQEDYEYKVISMSKWKMHHHYYVYALVSLWNKVVSRNQFVENDVVQARSLRVVEENDVQDPPGPGTLGLVITLAPVGQGPSRSSHPLGAPFVGEGNLNPRSHSETPKKPFDGPTKEETVDKCMEHDHY
ncbi:hypothetical protein Cgig2_019997 [Carnegiea gigantea]|uniref:Pectinesterase inhibitor domain-containing protein n=1 Tax=Carnegiea gigantea TaxID=171969 RepID=A0A9Q1QFY3_9CARY|nr:hypothetical protein Cgig2_019997 [Carnegiea gigantea]